MRPNSLEEQTLLEEESAKLSLDRLDRQETEALERGDAENSKVGRIAVNSLVDSVTKKLDLFLGNATSGSAGRKTALAAHFLNIPLTTEEIAYLSVRATMNLLVSPQRGGLTDIRVSQHISMRLVDEMFLRDVKENKSRLLKTWEKECTDRSLTRERAREFMRRQARNLEMDWTYVDAAGQEWDNAHQLKMGRMILEAVIQIRPSIARCRSSPSF